MFDTKILIDNGVNLEKSLELFGDIATYNDNLDEFLDGVEKLLENINTYKNQKDMANYAIVVHSLKSDAKYYGFEKLAELALNHELKSKENDVLYVNTHYDELKDEILRVTDLVQQYLGLDYEKTQVENQSTATYSILVVDDYFALACLRSVLSRMAPTVFLPPLRVRALVLVRWPCTGRFLRWRVPR